MNGEWKVYKRGDDLWLGFQRGHASSPTGLVKADVGVIERAMGPRPWRLNGRIRSLRQVTNARRVVAALGLTTMHNRKRGGPWAPYVDEHDLADYLDEHARGSEGQARLVLNALAAKLDTLEIPFCL